MSLDWDITKIKNEETVCWYTVPKEEADAFIKENRGKVYGPTYSQNDDGSIKVMKGVTQSFIFTMMALGCDGKITEENVDLVIEQMAILQKVGGALLQDGKDNDVCITAKDVRDHIGLKTNAFGKSTKKRAFKERMWRAIQEQAPMWSEEQATKGPLQELANIEEAA